MRQSALVWCVGIALGACGTSGSSGKGGTTGNGGTTGTGGTTGNGGTTGTGGSVSLTCGDGKVDPGEDCDQSQLNGSTCMSLGFDSGTLACSSNCRFSTSGCSGSLTPVITASRTTCAAPCEVFFDATKTTGLTGDDFVNAGFDWNFDTTKIDPAAAHQQAIGFNAGHVFEAPGTYQVSVIARDAAGHAGLSTVSITVSALSGATYYVASTGNDKNAGTTMAQPLATYSAAIAKAGPNVSVLFRRGDTFSVGSKTLQILVDRAVPHRRLQRSRFALLCRADSELVDGRRQQHSPERLRRQRHSAGRPSHRFGRRLGRHQRDRLTEHPGRTGRNRGGGKGSQHRGRPGPLQRDHLESDLLR